MDLGVLPMQCIWHDIVSRTLPWLWYSTLRLLRSSQANAATRSTSSRWSDLETCRAMGGPAEAHESIELSEFLQSRRTSSPRYQYSFSMPHDDSFDSQASSQDSNNHDTHHTADCKRVAHSQVVNRRCTGILVHAGLLGLLGIDLEQPHQGLVGLLGIDVGRPYHLPGHSTKQRPLTILKVAKASTHSQIHQMNNVPVVWMVNGSATTVSVVGIRATSTNSNFDSLPKIPKHSRRDIMHKKNKINLINTLPPEHFNMQVIGPVIKFVEVHTLPSPFYPTFKVQSLSEVSLTNSP